MLHAVGAGHSHVDRRGLPEVEYLVDDVGGLEEELQLWERCGSSWRSVATSSAVGLCFLRERDQYFPVHGPDGCRITQRDIDTAVGQPDVVEDDGDLLRPTMRRMAASTCAKYACVDSMRVPGGARTCRRI